MADYSDRPLKAYENEKFLSSKYARGLRILAEYMEPEARFEEFQVSDTVVFFGSARFIPCEDAEKNLETANEHAVDVAAAGRDLKMSAYYEAARELAHRLTEWSKNLEGEDRPTGAPAKPRASTRGSTSRWPMSRPKTPTSPES